MRSPCRTYDSGPWGTWASISSAPEFDRLPDDLEGSLPSHPLFDDDHPVPWQDGKHHAAWILRVAQRLRTAERSLDGLGLGFGRARDRIVVVRRIEVNVLYLARVKGAHAAVAVQLGARDRDLGMRFPAAPQDHPGKRLVHLDHLHGLRGGRVVALPFHVPHPGSRAIRADACDDSQLVVGQPVFLDRAGAARDGSNEAPSVSSQVAKQPSEYWLAIAPSSVGTLTRLPTRTISVKNLRLPSSKPGCPHGYRGRQGRPDRLRDGFSDQLVIGDLVRADRRQHAQHDVFIEGVRVCSVDPRVGADQVEHVGILGLVLADDEHDPDGHRLGLEQPGDRQDRPAPPALLVQGVPGAGCQARKACNRPGRALRGPAPERNGLPAGAAVRAGMWIRLKTVGAVSRLKRRRAVKKSASRQATGSLRAAVVSRISRLPFRLRQDRMPVRPEAVHQPGIDPVNHDRPGTGYGRDAYFLQPGMCDI